MIGLWSLVSLISAARELDLARLLVGNWTADVVPISSSPSNFTAGSLCLRLTETPEKTYLASFYENNESTDVLSSYSLTLEKVNFSIAELSLSGSFSSSIGDFQGINGQWENYLYTFTISSSTKARLTLIDPPSGVFVTVNFLKDIDRTPAPWYKAYGMQILMFGGLIITQVISFWGQRKMMGNASKQAVDTKRQAAARELAEDGEPEATQQEAEQEAKIEEVTDETEPTRRVEDGSDEETGSPKIEEVTGEEPVLRRTSSPKIEEVTDQ
jgi:hypothetical protein